MQIEFVEARQGEALVELSSLSIGHEFVCMCERGAVFQKTDSDTTDGFVACVRLRDGGVKRFSCRIGVRPVYTSLRWANTLKDLENCDG